MAKMSSKMAKYGSGSGLITNLVTIIIYVVAVYILYKIVIFSICVHRRCRMFLPLPLMEIRINKKVDVQPEHVEVTSSLLHSSSIHYII